MPAKRQRPESFSPPPPAVYVLVDGVSESSDPNAESTSPKQNDQLPLEENPLATATTRDADNDNIRQGSPEHDPTGDGIIYIDCSDKEERAVNGNVPEPPAGAAGDNSLLGLHQGLVAQSASIAALLAAPIGDSFVKLTEIPEHAGWNNEHHLGDMEGRALVIVAFGSLHFANLMFGHEMLPSFSITIKLFRDEDRVALQQLLDWAGSDEQEATRMLQAFHAGHDEDAQLLNVYNCMRGTDPGDEGIQCGLNELAAGDVVRLVMRCVKVVDEYNGRVSVDFKLRKVDLVVPTPHRNDIRN